MCISSMYIKQKIYLCVWKITPIQQKKEFDVYWKADNSYSEKMVIIKMYTIFDESLIVEDNEIKKLLAQRENTHKNIKNN